MKLVCGLIAVATLLSGCSDPRRRSVLEMEVLPGGVVILDHEKTSVQTDLASRLQKMAEQTPRPILLLKVSPVVRYDEGAKVMSMAQQAGLEIDLRDVLKTGRQIKP